MDKTTEQMDDEVKTMLDENTRDFAKKFLELADYAQALSSKCYAIGLKQGVEIGVKEGFKKGIEAGVKTDKNESLN